MHFDTSFSSIYLHFRSLLALCLKVIDLGRVLGNLENIWMNELDTPLHHRLDTISISLSLPIDTSPAGYS